MARRRPHAGMCARISICWRPVMTEAESDKAKRIFLSARRLAAGACWARVRDRALRRIGGASWLEKAWQYPEGSTVLGSPAARRTGDASGVLDRRGSGTPWRRIQADATGAARMQLAPPGLRWQASWKVTVPWPTKADRRSEK